jgi:ABC-type multidrug transport system fused ATPase/permease subunit
MTSRATRTSDNRLAEGIGYVILVIASIVAIVAIGLCIDLFYAWLFTMAINYGFNTHLHALHNLFWIVVVASSFLVMNAGLSWRSKRS